MSLSVPDMSSHFTSEWFLAMTYSRLSGKQERFQNRKSVLLPVATDRMCVLKDKPSVMSERALCYISDEITFFFLGLS